MRKLRPTRQVEPSALLGSVLSSSSELRYGHRLHAVCLVSLGFSCSRVAQWFGEDPRTVARWVHAYDRRGAEGLHETARTGRASRLSAQQKTQLAQDLAKDPTTLGYAQPRWSGKLLALHLSRHFDVELSQRQCQRLLLDLRH